MNDDGNEAYQFGEADEEFKERVSNVIRILVDELEKLGIMVRSASPASLPAIINDPVAPEIEPDDSMEDNFNSGAIGIFVAVEATTNPIAFSERILDPEAHSQAQAFRMDLPTEEEVQLRDMQEEIKKMLGDDDDG